MTFMSFHNMWLISKFYIKISSPQIKSIELQNKTIHIKIRVISALETQCSFFKDPGRVVQFFVSEMNSMFWSWSIFFQKINSFF